MIVVKINWTDFKAFVSARKVPMHETAIGDTYLLHAIDGPVARECLINDSADITDYETNYQTAANTSYTDSNGITLARTKITESGWHFQMYAIEFETAKLNSVVNKDADGSTLNHTSIKFYNSAGTELTSGTQLELDLNCTKTVVDWEPTWDYEIIGGQFRQLSIPSDDIRLHIIGVPDVPAQYGGSVPFVNNLNLRYIGNEDNINTDGRTSKHMTYDATNHTNKFRVVLEHGLLIQHKVQLLFEIFRA